MGRFVQTNHSLKRWTTQMVSSWVRKRSYKTLRQSFHSSVQRWAKHFPCCRCTGGSWLYYKHQTDIIDYRLWFWTFLCFRFSWRAVFGTSRGWNSWYLLRLIHQQLLSFWDSHLQELWFSQLIIVFPFVQPPSQLLLTLTDFLICFVPFAALQTSSLNHHNPFGWQLVLLAHSYSSGRVVKDKFLLISVFHSFLFPFFSTSFCFSFIITSCWVIIFFWSVTSFFCCSSSFLEFSAAFFNLLTSFFKSLFAFCWASSSFWTTFES